jgi:hypothetical protein
MNYPFIKFATPIRSDPKLLKLYRSVGAITEQFQVNRTATFSRDGSVYH